MDNETQKLNNADKSLISIRQLFKSSWQIYKNRFRVLILISLPPFILSALLTATYVFESSIFWAIISFIILISWFILFLLASLALIYALYNESLGVIAAYKAAFSKFRSYLWLNILFFSISLGGLAMGIIPVFIFMIWFSFAAYILVNQNLYGLQALLKSKEYVAGYWWKVFGRMLIYLLVTTGISFMSFMIIVPFYIYILGGNIAAANIINDILWIFLLPLTVIYLFILYHSLVSLKPELASQPVKTKKRFFIFCAILGAIIALLITLFVLFAQVIIGFNKIKQKAYPVQQVMSDFPQIQIYLNDYYLTKKYYPSASKSDHLKFDGKSLVIANPLHFLKDILIKDKDKAIRFYSYSISDDGQNYILGAILEDKNNPLLENDEDGIIYRVNCDDPVYCVKS